MLPIIRLFSKCAIAAVLLAGQSILADEAVPPSQLEVIKGAASSGIGAHELEEIRNQAASVDMEKIAAEAKAAAEGIQLPANKNEEANKAAQQAAALFNSPEFQNRLHQLQEKLPLRDATEAEKGAGKEEKIPGALASEEKVYLFLSSSIPEEDVHSLLHTVAHTGDQGIVPVMYGFIGGIDNHQHQGKYFGRVLREDSACTDTPQTQCERFKTNLKINSSLFKQYNVSETPTVVYDNGVKSWSISGNATLGYLLEQINQDAQSPALQRIVKRLEGAR